MAKKVFVTGATGYIGGSVASGLVQKGYEVYGLTRSADKSSALESLGMKPVVGTLCDYEVLAETASIVDVVINAASSDNRDALDLLLKALAGSGKMYFQNSGSTVVSERGEGKLSDKIFDETSQYEPVAEKKARVELDNTVLAARSKNIKTYVVCPCLIYGEGLGLKKESAQIPALVKQAMESSVARYIGEGENIWSSIHIEDLVDLYHFLIEEAPAPGSFFFAASGEVRFKDIVERIKRELGLSQIGGWSIEEASSYWGEGMAVFALASNSRVRARRAGELGWSPRNDTTLDDVGRTCKNLTALKR